MANEELQHKVIQAIKEVSRDLGRAPSRREFISHEKGLPFRNVETAFGLWSAAVKAAGFEPYSNKPADKKQKFRYFKKLIDSFHIHETDLDDLFRRAGNPETLKLVGMPDTHVENRDHQAVTAFLEFCEWYQPHVFLMYGDFLDAEGISHWPAGSLKPRDFISEVIEGRELIAEIVRRTKSVISRIYLCGNHEAWIEQAMVAKLPELFRGLEKLGLTPDLTKLLDLEAFSIDLIPMNHLLKIGNSYHTHGLYTGNSHPKKHLDTVKDNIYYGHLHDMHSTHQPTVNGMIEAASCGHLAKNDAPFLKGRPNNWQQGFHIIEFFKDGSFSRYPIKINSGRFSLMGKTFGVK